jgi:GTP-binding protein EngB required for normal cell division
MNNLKENTNYIFTFGNTEVGKSSMLASLCEFIHKSSHLRLRKNLLSNEEGHRFLREHWLDRFRKNMFPPRSNRGEIYEIDVGIQELEDDKILPITFLEMSGEDLMVFDSMHSDPELEELKTKFVSYLNASKLILLVTTPQSCSEDDYSFDELFEIIDQKGLSFPIGMIITKIDTLTQDNLDLQSYIFKNMPSTYKWVLKHGVSYPTKTFFYSTGTPDTSDIFKINRKNYSAYAGEVLMWVYDILDN